MGIKKIHCFIDSLCSGGAQRQIVKLATMLKESGYDVSVVVYYSNEFYKQQLDLHGVPCILVANTGNPIKRIWALYRYWKTHSVDVVIAYLGTPSLIACLLRPFLRWRRLIVSERNTNQTITCRDRIKFLLWRYADYIVPNSYTQTAFINKWVPRYSNKVITITNGVDVNKFLPICSQANIKPLRILTVARITPQKNLIRYIEAISRLNRKGYTFVVDWFGNTDNPLFMNQCASVIKKYELSEVFRFHPARVDIVEEYQTSSVLCLPSLYEGFPNVICEAMSCGLPILCGNVCDNSTLVIDGENGCLFDPKSVDSIEATIERFLKLSQQDRLEMGKLSRIRAMSVCAPEEMLKKYIKLFGE